MSAGTQDIRLTTRYDETDLGVSLFASIHEFGHGFYESDVDPAMERTSLSSVTSMSLHESQSRMWENLVGRGLPMWRFFYPRLQATFPDQFGNVELDEFYGAINKVQPSLIRVEADEATYNLHIILRFELEQEILSGELPLEDLPEAWNARMADYLGIDVPDDTRGVLQDVHWSGGAIGYFPTYALGNVVSVQLWDKLRGELPDLDAQFEKGEFGELAGWLRDNLHVHGRKYTSKEMLERIVGGGMDPGAVPPVPEGEARRDLRPPGRGRRHCLGRGLNVPGVTQLGRVIVPVSDQDAAIAFYTDKLGFTVSADIPYGEGDRWVEVEPPGGGTGIALSRGMGEFQPGRETGIALTSPDPRADYEELKGNGVDVDEELMGGDGTVPLLFMFRDGDGNGLMIVEEES